MEPTPRDDAQDNAATRATRAYAARACRGANIDFIDNLMGWTFKIDNPLAAASCRCGWNFANSTDKI
jgi:Fe-S cluster assembly iron-binding protein IscA